MQHAEAVEHFEEVATKLYDLLKRKEDAEQSLNHYMQSKAQIEKLREQSSFINSLINQIEHMKKKVQSARHLMEKKQNILTEAHIEMRKIEKLIEKRTLEKVEVEQIGRAHV